MKMLRRSVCLLLCAALFLTLLAGCGKQEEPAEDFVVSAAVCGPLETLDPTMNTDVGAESLLSTLFEGLMRMRDDGAGKAVAVAGIAKEYIEEKNYDDTVTYTFTLRSAARWSDGERVTAEDFVYAWQRLVDPATASPNASLLSMVAGYDEVRESGDVSLLGVKAKGESTFLVTLSRPCAYFITSVCTSPATAPLRRDLVEGNASWAATADIVTNGPYTVGTWVKAAQLQTKRNGEYYESKLVVPDSICFRFETDAQTNYDQLLAGELDYTAKLPYAAIEQLAEDETWQPAPLAETVCVLYNHLTDTFSDAQLRRDIGLIEPGDAERAAFVKDRAFDERHALADAADLRLGAENCEHGISVLICDVRDARDLRAVLIVARIGLQRVLQGRNMQFFEQLHLFRADALDELYAVCDGWHDVSPAEICGYSLFFTQNSNRESRESAYEKAFARQTHSP